MTIKNIFKMKKKALSNFQGLYKNLTKSIIGGDRIKVREYNECTCKWEYYIMDTETGKCWDLLGNEDSPC